MKIKKICHLKHWKKPVNLFQKHHYSQHNDMILREEILKSNLLEIRKKMMKKELTIKEYYSIYFEYKNQLEDFNIFISERTEEEIINLALQRNNSNDILMGIPFVVNDNLDTNYLPTTKQNFFFFKNKTKNKIFF
jgi:hypothetical protein